MCTSLQACTINATLQLAKVNTNSVTLYPWESLEYLNQFQCIPHHIFTAYNSLYGCAEKHLMFSTETHGDVIFSTKSEKKNMWELKGEHIRLSDFIFQDPPMTRLILSSSTKTTFHRLTTTKICKSKSISFWQNLHFVSATPCVTHAEVSWPVLDFWCYRLQTKTMNIELIQLTS